MARHFTNPVLLFKQDIINSTKEFLNNIPQNKVEELRKTYFRELNDREMSYSLKERNKMRCFIQLTS